MDMIDRLESIIFYFEGSCEFCLANKGIETYKAQVGKWIGSGERFDGDVMVRLYYAHALIQYKTNNIQGAFDSWQKARDYAETTGDMLYLGKSYSFLAVCYYIQGDRDRERYCFTRAEEIFTELANYGELASHYINILWYKRYERDKAEIIQYLDKAFAYVQRSTSMKNARVYLHLGYIYKTIFNDYTKCLGYLVKSNELCREFGFTEMESMTFHVLADVYIKIDKPAETIRIYTEILENDKFKNITPNLKASILCNLVSCYIRVRDLNSAGEYLAQLEDVLPGVQTSIEEQFRALALGLRAVYIDMTGGDHKEALALMLKAEEIYEKYRQNFILEEFPYMIASRKGDMYLALGDPAEALASYRKMEKLAEDLGRYERKNAYEKLARYHAAQEAYGESLAYYKQADAVCREIDRINQDIQYETMYKDFISRVKEQERIYLKEQNTALEKQGNIDVLTGTYNRNYLTRYIDNMAGAGMEHGLTVLMVDIDSLKQYNDVHGHLRGDDAIKSIAGVFFRRCRSCDRIIRYGGDEFLIILEGVARDHGTAIAQELIRNVEQLGIEYEYFGIRGRVTASVGIATREPGSGMDLEAMIREADRALYQAKDQGKCRAVHFDDIRERESH